MKVSTEIGSISKIVSEEKAIEYVAKAGFDAWDFSMTTMCRYQRKLGELLENSHPLASENYLSFARKLRRVADDNGIVCNQSHAPFPTDPPQVRPYLMKAIECTAEAGGKICIIHPMARYSPEENAEMYHTLLPFAKECGVKIATENMWDWSTEKGHSTFAACATPKSFLDHLNAVNDDFLVACLDIGHAEMKGSDTTAVEMIHALGEHLQALHIHDNDKLHDSHQIPFSMNIDFVPIVKALKDIGYKGYFTLECDRYCVDVPEEEVFGAVKDLYKAVRKLVDMYEEA